MLEGVLPHWNGCGRFGQPASSGEVEREGESAMWRGEGGWFLDTAGVGAELFRFLVGDLPRALYAEGLMTLPLPPSFISPLEFSLILWGCVGVFSRAQFVTVELKTSDNLLNVLPDSSSGSP